METVKSFNAEVPNACKYFVCKLQILCFFLQLSSLYEMKPPISKAKMTAITKGAIKAVKFYKHVVQSVEKFLQKVSFDSFQLKYLKLILLSFAVPPRVQDTWALCD